MKREKISLLIAGFICISLISLLFWSFFQKNSETTELNDQRFVNQIMNQYVRYVDNSLQGASKCLDHVAAVLEKSDEKEVRKEMEGVQESSVFLQMGFVYQDGTTSLNGCGDRLLWGGVYKKLQRGNKGVSQVMSSSTDGQKLVIFYTPVSHKNSKIIGLVGSYEVDKLMQSFSGDSVPFVSGFNLISEGGDLIAGSGKFSEEIQDGDLFTALLKSGADKRQEEKLKDNFKKGKEGSILFSSKSPDYVGYYKKLENYQWMAYITIPKSVIKEMTVPFRQSGMWFMVCVMSACTGMIIWAVRKLGGHNKELSQINENLEKANGSYLFAIQNLQSDAFAWDTAGNAVTVYGRKESVFPLFQSGKVIPLEKFMQSFPYVNFEQMLHELDGGGNQSVCETSLSNVQQRDVCVRIMLNKVSDSNGQTNGIIGLVKDISREIVLRRRLIRMQEMLLDNVEQCDAASIISITNNQLLRFWCGGKEQESDIAEDALKRYRSSVNAEDRERIRRLSDRDYLLDKYMSGCYEFEQVVKFDTYDGVRWCQYCLKLYEIPETDEKRAVIMVFDLDKEEVEEEKSHRRAARYDDVLKLLEESYYRIFFVNITWDFYEKVRGELEEEEAFPTPDEGTFTEQIIQCSAKYIYSDDIDKYVDFLSRDNLFELYNSGISESEIEVRRINKGGKCWIAVRVFFIRTDERDRKCVVTFQDIDKSKHSEMEHRVYSRQYGIAMSASYDRLYEVNLEEDKIWSIIPSPNGITRSILACCFSEYHQRILETVCMEDYALFERYLGPKNIGRTDKDGSYFEGRIPDKQGEFIWWAYTIRKVVMDDQERYMIYVKNVNQTKREDEKTREILRNAMLTAQEANRAKSDFLARMSHDIRTPMNGIMGMTDIAMHSLDSPEKMKDCLNKISMSSNFLLTLINDVLDMSRIESGRMEITNKDANLQELFQSIYDMTEPQARKNDMTLELSYDPKLSKYYHTDALKLRQITLNLLSNSIKYAGKGKQIMLRLELLQRKEKGDYIQFIVEDNGKGMHKEFLDKIYLPFEQEHPEKTGELQGTGLGMSIVNQIVHMMDGTIHVESQLGEGTVTTIRMSLKPVEKQEADWEIEEAGKDLAGCRILLVEDNELNMEITHAILERGGLRVEEAENGEVALEKFVDSEQGHFNAILMDIQMPVMNGYEATKAIRESSHPQAQTIPILALSANAFQEDVDKSIQSGMNDHLSKPIDWREIKKSLARFLC